MATRADLHVEPVQQRQGKSAPVTVEGPRALGEYEVVLDIPTAEYEDPNNAVFVDLYMEDARVPGGWRPLVSNRPGGWVGGRVVEDGVVNPPYTLSVTITQDMIGRAVRAEVETKTRMRAGVSIKRVE